MRIIKKIKISRIFLQVVINFEQKFFPYVLSKIFCVFLIILGSIQQLKPIHTLTHSHIQTFTHLDINT